MLPIANQTGKKGGKVGKKGKSKFGAPGPDGHGDVQVNLIVDPKAFQPLGMDDLSDEDGEEDGDGDSLDKGGGMMPGGYEYWERERSRRKKRRQRRRRGLVEGLKMEEEWKAARSWAKKITAVDVIGLILWSGAFVFIMIGQRCPSGSYRGW